MLELLSPAGSMEALRAAVQNGANAVYLGYDRFHARMGAQNFSADELQEAIVYCHVCGVRSIEMPSRMPRMLTISSIT